MSIKKVRNIVKAFSSKLPIEEQWYQDRLSICKTCPLNSDNVEKLNFEQKTVSNTVCGGNAVCTACGCCVDRKASIKAETCGLIEKPELGEPKWEALQLEGASADSNIIVECLKEEPHKFTYEKDFFEVEFEAKGNSVSIPFNVTRTGRKLEVREVSASCGCTASKAEVKDDDSVDVNYTVSLKNFKVGVKTAKTAKMRYTIGNNVQKEIFFKFKITKNE